MNCRQADEALIDLVYGELDTAAAGDVRDHLNGCPRCREERRRLQFARSMLAKYCAGQPDAERLRARAGELVGTARPAAGRRLWLRACAGVAACIVAGLLVGRFAFPPARRAPSDPGGRAAAPDAAGTWRVLLGPGPAGLSSTVQRSMGEYVRAAELIAIANTEPGPRGLGTVAHFQEVLKGDAGKGGAWGSPLVQQASTPCDPYVPRQAKGVALLFAPGWRADPRGSLLATYQKPDEVNLLREMVKIYGLPTERERLLGIWRRYGSSPLYKTQLFVDLEQMREPASFPVITDIFPKLDAPGRRRLVNLMGHMGDPRGLATLLAALESPDERVGRAAATTLVRQFPGCPGVTDALRKAMGRKHLRRTAATYLVKRFPADPAVIKAIADLRNRSAERPPYTKALLLLRAGETEKAKAVFLAIVEDANAPPADRTRAAHAAVGLCDEQGKARIRRAVLGLLGQEALGTNGFAALQATETLRGLRDPDCLDPLMRVLEHNCPRYDDLAREATFAIAELGPAARQKAAEGVLRRIRDMLRPGGTGHPHYANGTHSYFLQLAWLGDAAAFGEVEQVLPPSDRKWWDAIRPVLGAGDGGDAGRLRKLLEAHPQMVAVAREWIVVRLGELRDARAAGVLASLVTEPGAGMLREAAKEALIRIGGREVEEQMTQLLRHEQTQLLPHEQQYVRRIAMEVLFRVQGPRMLPVLRKLIAAKDSRVRSQACIYLGQVGTPADIERLAPLADFWKGDRSVHYAAVGALGNLRERYGCDVSGPITK